MSNLPTLFSRNRAAASRLDERQRAAAHRSGYYAYRAMLAGVAAWAIAFQAFDIRVDPIMILFSLMWIGLGTESVIRGRDGLNREIEEMEAVAARPWRLSRSPWFLGWVAISVVAVQVHNGGGWLNWGFDLTLLAIMWLLLVWTERRDRRLVLERIERGESRAHERGRRLGAAIARLIHSETPGPSA